MLVLGQLFLPLFSSVIQNLDVCLCDILNFCFMALFWPFLMLTISCWVDVIFVILISKPFSLLNFWSSVVEMFPGENPFEKVGRIFYGLLYQPLARDLQISSNEGKPSDCVNNLNIFFSLAKKIFPRWEWKRIKTHLALGGNWEMRQKIPKEMRLL